MNVKGQFNEDTDHLEVHVNGKEVHNGIAGDATMFFNVLGLDDEYFSYESRTSPVIHFEGDVKREWIHEALHELANPVRLRG